MIVSRRINASSVLDGRLATHALLHTQYRLHAVDNRNVVSDDRLTFRGFARKGALTRPAVVILLEGRARLGDGHDERWLEPGDVAFIPAKGRAIMRQEARPHYRTIVFEWEASWGGRPSRLAHRHASAQLLAASRRLWDAVASRGDREECERELGAWLEALSSEGGPRHAPALVEHVPDSVVELSDALDRTLSSLDGRPMVIDLESALDLSARQLARRVREFNERYGFNADSWRDARGRRRLMVALVFLSIRHSSVADVARAVGDGSAAALCHAFAKAGFPPPATVLDELGHIGREPVAARLPPAR